MVQVRQLTELELAPRRVAVYELLEAVEVVAIGAPVVRRASQSLPTPLGTLDALHLATADRVTGFTVVGV